MWKQKLLQGIIFTSLNSPKSLSNTVHTVCNHHSMIIYHLFWRPVCKCWAYSRINLTTDTKQGEPSITQEDIPTLPQSIFLLLGGGGVGWGMGESPFLTVSFLTIPCITYVVSNYDTRSNVSQIWIQNHH